MTESDVKNRSPEVVRVLGSIKLKKLLRSDGVNVIEYSGQRSPDRGHWNCKFKFMCLQNVLFLPLRSTLPGKYHELNIHFGIWLGGLAGFNEIFLGNLPSFRGCMSHITYNSEDVLLRAKTQAGQVSIFFDLLRLQFRYSFSYSFSPVTFQDIADDFLLM